MNTTPFPHSRDQQHHAPEPGPPAAPATWWRGGHGWLDTRLHEIRTAPQHGWKLMATWIRTTITVTGLLAVLLALRWIGDTLLDWAHALPWPMPTDPTGLLTTIDQPVHTYLASRTATLPVTATTAYAAWQAVGASAFVLGFLRSTGARLTWTAWGAATVAMVWHGTPEPGRQVAAGIAVLAWTTASALALRGLNLRPRVFADIHVPAPQVTVQPHIHVPAQPDGGAPDNVRQLNR
ncbi:hypothetical protein ACFXKG_30755 [Streptomyces sp. NPDC059255]|uniref:hypothetical protein n=1 Tax=Streptomyces sp. NPDC059255 TaxID=3346793 RepID=UPI0036A2ADEF